MQYTLPPGFSLRRPTIEDLKQTVEMIRASEKAENGRVRTTENDLRVRWSEDPNYDISVDGWLLIAPDGCIAGTIGVGHREVTRMHCGPKVHPDYAGLGLYAYLLELGLERACECVPHAPPDTRVTLNVYTSDKAVEAYQALKSAGFTHVRSDWLMQIDMDQPPPEPVWGQGLELRPYAPEMLYSVYLADDEAFQDHWGYMPHVFEQWQKWNNQREGFDPSLWFVAFDGEEIAGIALCGYEDGEAWIGELGVRRPWRKRGLGLALLHHAFGKFYRRGTHRVILNADSQNLTGAIRLYTHAGMRQVEQYDIYQLELRAGKELSTETLAV